MSIYLYLCVSIYLYLCVYVCVCVCVCVCVMRPGWKVYKSSKLGKPYWYHKASGTTTWSPPSLSKVAPSSATETSGASAAGPSIGAQEGGGSGEGGRARRIP